MTAPESREAGGNAGLVRHVEGALEDCFRSFATLPDAVIDERPDFLAVRTGLPLTFCNGVVRTRFGADANACVQQTIESFRAHGVAFRWWLLPSNQPPELIALLAANGMRHFFYATGMVADLERMPAPREVPGLEIVRVRDAATLQTWADIFAAGFSQSDAARAAWLDLFTRFGFDDASPWRTYLGILDGEPVSTSALCLGPEIGGIYHVVTLPQARGRGVGAAITAAPMRDTRAAGRRIASLQASEMAVGVYRSLGFVACCDLELYDWRPEYEAATPVSS